MGLLLSIIAASLEERFATAPLQRFAWKAEVPLRSDPDLRSQAQAEARRLRLDRRPGGWLYGRVCRNVPGTRAAFPAYEHATRTSCGRS
jgi:hypothetical protein